MRQTTPRFRIIPRFETYPRVVNFAQTVPGKALLLAIFGITLSNFDDAWLSKLAALSVIAFLPHFRRFLVLVCTIIFTHFFLFESNFLRGIATAESVRFTRLQFTLVIILPFALLSVLFMWVASRHKRSIVARRPVVCLLGIYAVLMVAARYGSLHGSLRFCLWAF